MLAYFLTINYLANIWEQLTLSIEVRLVNGGGKGHVPGDLSAGNNSATL